MSKRNTLSCIQGLVLTLALSGNAKAQDVFVAGWDFSQYIGANALSIDCLTIAGSLVSNYSDFDPPFGAGAESAAFGTMYNDGTNGSTDSTGGGMLPVITPTAGAISENEDAPLNMVPDPDVAFNSLLIQNQEIPGANPPVQGQKCSTHQDVSMITQQALSVVFVVDVSTLSPGDRPSGDGWTVSFGASTALLDTMDVDIDFAGGADPFANVDTVTLTASEQTFSVPLGDSAADTVSVRLTFPTPAMAGAEGIFDNVAITVPEPTGGAAAALVTLMALARHRRGRH